MLSRDDMLAASLTVAGQSVGEVAVVRIDGPELRMPPPPASSVPTDERDVFAAWVADGMPSGDCTPDDLPPDPFDVDPTCTTDTWWEGGLFEESPNMDPGRACIACHDDPASFGGDPGEGGPSFGAAGTVYRTAHEPDDCFGDGTPDTWIELTGANGNTVRTAVRSSGNFFFEAGDVEGVPLPYQARLISGDLERVMIDPAPHGDCNLCHTQDGDEDAPGRIVMP